MHDTIDERVGGTGIELLIRKSPELLELLRRIST